MWLAEKLRVVPYHLKFFVVLYYGLSTDASLQSGRSTYSIAFAVLAISSCKCILNSRTAKCVNCNISGYIGAMMSVLHQGPFHRIATPLTLLLLLLCIAFSVVSRSMCDTHHRLTNASCVFSFFFLYLFNQ